MRSTKKLVILLLIYLLIGFIIDFETYNLNLGFYVSESFQYPIARIDKLLFWPIILYKNLTQPSRQPPQIKI